MAENNPGFFEQKRREAAKIWLSYYNRVLYKKGIITARERSQMELKIDKWQMPVQMPQHR